jgi:hypothetical protein
VPADNILAEEGHIRHIDWVVDNRLHSLAVEDIVNTVAHTVDKLVVAHTDTSLPVVAAVELAVAVALLALL